MSESENIRRAVVRGVKEEAIKKFEVTAEIDAMGWLTVHTLIPGKMKSDQEEAVIALQSIYSEYALR